VSHTRQTQEGSRISNDSGKKPGGRVRLIHPPHRCLPQCRQCITLECDPSRHLHCIHHGRVGAHLGGLTMAARIRWIEFSSEIMSKARISELSIPSQCALQDCGCKEEWNEIHSMEPYKATS
jgi:hypothetical protein